MNELKVFNNKEFGEIRTIVVDNEPYFVGKDIAKILGYKDVNRAVKQHVSKEDLQACDFKAYGDLYPSLWSKTNDFSNKILINESGLYALIFASELPNAKKFKKWVTSEVLPSIRKHGAYMTDETLEEVLTSPDFLIQLATKLKEEKEKNKTLKIENKIKEQQIAELKPKADYMDNILSSKSLVTITQIAKDYGMAGKTLNKILHDLRIQYKQSGQWLLYAKHQDKGYTHSETVDIPLEDGTSKVVMNTKWTQKGRLFLYNKLKENGILPTVEVED